MSSGCVVSPSTGDPSEYSLTHGGVLALPQVLCGIHYRDKDGDIAVRGRARCVGVCALRGARHHNRAFQRSWLRVALAATRARRAFYCFCSPACAVKIHVHNTLLLLSFSVLPCLLQGLTRRRGGWSRARRRRHVQYVIVGEHTRVVPDLLPPPPPTAAAGMRACCCAFPCAARRANNVCPNTDSGDRSAQAPVADAGAPAASIFIITRGCVAVCDMQGVFVTKLNAGDAFSPESSAASGPRGAPPAAAAEEAAAAFNYAALEVRGRGAAPLLLLLLLTPLTRAAPPVHCGRPGV